MNNFIKIHVWSRLLKGAETKLILNAPLSYLALVQAGGWKAVLATVGN